MSTLPSTPGFSSLALDYNRPIFTDVSESGKTQIRSGGGHLWSMKITYPVMTRSQFAPIDGVICSLDLGTNYLEVRYPLENVGTWNTVTPVLTGSGLVAGVTNMTISLTTGLTIKAGDLFTASIGSKVYKVVSDTVSVAGSAVVQFRPAAVETFIAGNLIFTTDIDFRMRIKGVHSFKVEAPELYRYELDLEEYRT